MKKKLPTAQLLPSGQYRCRVMVNGERVSVVDADPNTAQAKAIALQAGLMEQEKKPLSMTVGEAIDRYIESKDSVLSPSTIAGYKKQRRNTFKSLMNVQLRDLTQEAIQKAVNSMSKDKSPKYVKNAHGLLSAVLGVYRPDMTLHTTLPQNEKYEIAIPATEEIDKIAEFVKGKKFELPFLLGAWLGLRTSEIRGLKWDCVSDGIVHIKRALVDGVDGPKLKLTKTYSSDRKLKIPPYIQQLIKQQPKTDDFIIHYNRNQLYKCLERACKSCGIRRYRFHDLRHYQASLMLMLGVPDKYAMERMGHASTNMLKNVYQHTMTSKSEEVADTVDNFFNKNLDTNLDTDNKDS